MQTRAFDFNGLGLASLAFGLYLAACGSGGSRVVQLNAVSYSTLNYPSAAPGSSTFLTGIRGADNHSNVYMTGIYEPSGSGMIGLDYEGPLTGAGSWHTLSYPSSPGVTVTSTALYGPDNDGAGNVILVGDYSTLEQGPNIAIGLMYQGPLDGSGTWTTINPPSAAVTIPHSTMGGLIVGNYDTSVVLLTGKAFIYDISSGSYDELVKPGALSITAYGIWYNGGTSYTITGGYTDAAGAGGYLVDWSSATHTSSNWSSYTDPMGVTSLLTHFEGITADGMGGYNLAADQVTAGTSGPVVGAAFANVPRTSAGSFGDAVWRAVSYPNATLTSANSVYQNSIIGIYQQGADVSNGYVATGF